MIERFALLRNRIFRMFTLLYTVIRAPGLGLAEQAWRNLQSDVDGWDQRDDSLLVATLALNVRNNRRVTPSGKLHIFKRSSDVPYLLCRNDWMS